MLFREWPLFRETTEIVKYTKSAKNTNSCKKVTARKVKSECIMCKSKEVENEEANEKNAAQLVKCLPTVAQGRPLLLGQKFEIILTSELL